MALSEVDVPQERYPGSNESARRAVPACSLNDPHVPHMHFVVICVEDKAMRGICQRQSMFPP